MVERAISGLMLVVAVIHLLPITGFFGVDRLASLYGIEITDGEDRVRSTEASSRREAGDLTL